MSRRRHPFPVWAWLAVGAGVAVLVAAVAVAVVADRRSGSAVYPRDEFRAALIGKTEDEVLSLVGRPASTQDTRGGVYWYYRDRTRDPVTGRVDRRVQVVFRNGVVDAVNFH